MTSCQRPIAGRACIGMLRAFLCDTESLKGCSLTGLYYLVQVGKTHKGLLRWPGVSHNSLHFPAESPASTGYFLAGFVLKARYEFGEFERSKQSVIVFKVNDDVVVRG